MVKISVAAFTFSTFSAAATFAVYAIRRFFPASMTGNAPSASVSLPSLTVLQPLMLNAIFPASLPKFS